MLTKQTRNLVIGVGSLFFTGFSMAADSPSDMSKDQWLKSLKSVVPAMICKSYLANEQASKQLAAANINYDKCVALIPDSFDKCQTKSYDEIPATINNEIAEKWGSTIGECIGADFAANHLTASAPSTSQPEAASSDSMTKDVWFSKLKAAVPDAICKGFLADSSLGPQLKQKNIDYNKCLTLIPASVDKCQNNLYSSVPATIDSSNADHWGNAIGECIGKDFAVNHLI